MDKDLSEGVTFQSRVDKWLLACFGEEIARDLAERNHRFLEEALELVQASGCTASEAHQLVDYTFGRPVGERGQEVGGVMNTLAALCLAYGLDMEAEGNREIDRCWVKIDRIREKQRNKPKHSPLPESLTRPSPVAGAEARENLGEQLDGVREGLRLFMLDQPSRGRRETYSDGFAQGICYAIGEIDRIRNPALNAGKAG